MKNLLLLTILSLTSLPAKARDLNPGEIGHWQRATQVVQTQRWWQLPFLLLLIP